MVCRRQHSETTTKLTKQDPPSTKEYRGPAAPVTCLALSADGKTLFAGCWDKSVWSWDVATRKPLTRYAGHNDFVKSVRCARLSSSSGAVDLLISAGADSNIVVWDVATGAKRHVIRGHTRGVLGLAIQQSVDEDEAKAPSFILWSAGSDQSILRHRVSLDAVEAMDFPSTSTTSSDADELAETQPALVVHDTSVNALAVYALNDDVPEVPGAMLLTASSDKSAKRVFPSLKGPEECKTWTEAQVMPHGDFVQDVLALSSERDVVTGGLVCPSNTLIATACRDEEIRIWDAEDQGASEPLFTLSGHFDAVSGLALVTVNGERKLVSVSLDGTVRTWPVDRAGIEKAVLEHEKNQRAVLSSTDAQESVPADNQASKSMLTEEEERELAELMDEDD